MGRSSTFTHAEDSGVFAEGRLCREAGVQREMLPGVDGQSSCGYGDGRRRQSVNLVGVTEDASGIGYA